MSAVSDTRMSILAIINEVEKKLGLNASATLTASIFTEVLLQLLNEVVDEVADDGDWLEMRAVVNVTAASSTRTYDVTAASTSLTVHHIDQIYFGARPAPLQLVPYARIKQLSTNSAIGTPSQWGLVSVNASADPVFEVFPCPGSAEADLVMAVHILRKPRIYTTSDAALVPPFPALTLIAGLHARAVLEESGQEPTGQGRATFQLAGNQRGQSLNRFTTDGGSSIKFRPRR